MHRLKLFSALAVLATVAVLAGCGSSGSSGVSAASYVKAVCSAVVPFKNDLQTRGSALSFSGAKNITDIKKGLQGFMAAIVTDSDKAVSALKSAGLLRTAGDSSIAFDR